MPHELLPELLPIIKYQRTSLETTHERKARITNIASIDVMLTLFVCSKLVDSDRIELEIWGQLLTQLPDDALTVRYNVRRNLLDEKAISIFFPQTVRPS